MISHLLGSLLAATFVRPRLRFWCSFSRSRFSLPLWQCKGFGGLPVCQRLRRQLVPCGEAFWPQPLPASQAPAGNTFLGLWRDFRHQAGRHPAQISKNRYSAPVYSRKYLFLQSLRSHKGVIQCKLMGSRLPQFAASFFFLKRKGRPPSAAVPHLLRAHLSFLASSHRSPFGIVRWPYCLRRGRSSMRCPHP